MKKSLRALAVGLVLTISMSMVAGCGAPKAEQKAAEPPAATPAATTSLKVMALTGPTGMGMVKLMDDAVQKKTAGNYEITLAGAADEISAKMIKGEIDIAAVPCNLASILYNKTKGNIQVAAINTLGVLYVLEKGDSIHSVADLKGKTIVSTGKGTTPEYILNYLLKANGLDPVKDVTITYKTEAAEIAAAFQSGEAQIAMVPQPVATTIQAKNEGVRAALDVTAEWEKAQGAEANQLVTGTIIVRKDVLEKNKAAVDQFLTEYQASIAYVNSHVEDSAKLIEAYKIVPSAAIAQKALPQCNIVYIDGVQMQKNISAYLKVLFEADPAAVGGQLPDEHFYYQQ